MGNNIISAIFKKPLFKVLFSIFRFLCFPVKAVSLAAISVTYFVIGGLAAVLYLVLYEKLFKTLLISLETNRQKDPYYY